jgi:hypothetical protein
VGESYYWIYVKADNADLNVLAFDEKMKDHIKEIDWDMTVQRNVLNIIETIFEAMKWENSFIPVKIKRTRKSKQTKSTNESGDWKGI